MKFTGGCLCGAVRYECTAEPAMAGICHCEDCRRSSGAGHSAHLAAPEDKVTITGQTSSYAKPADSGNIVNRHFCGTCGAPVFSRNGGMPGMIFFRASSLDDLEVFKPEMHVFAGRAATWDRPREGVPAFARMPPGMG